MSSAPPASCTVRCRSLRRVGPGRISAGGLAPLLLSLGLLASFAARPARGAPLGALLGKPLRLDSTWTLHLHAHGDNGDERDDNDDYGDLLSIYELKANWGDHTAGLRFDALRFFAPPTGDVIVDSGSADYADEYVIEKLYWNWRRSGFDVSVGDQYVTFGRGLALSLTRDDQLGIDASLRGLYAEYSARYVKATFTGGWTNAANLDTATERLRFSSCSPTFGGSCDPLAIDPQDQILAGRLEGRLPGRARLGLLEVALLREGEDERTLLHGAYLELPTLPYGLGDLYVEGVQLLPPGEGQEDGLGIYGALNVYLGPVSLLVEAKHYEHFLLQTTLPPNISRYSSNRTIIYHEPPSLEPLKTIAYDNDNSTGGRLKLDAALDATHSQLSLAGAQFDTGTEGAERRVRHVYGGLEQDLPARIHLLLSGGVRWDEPSEDSRGAKRHLEHTEGKLEIPITGPHAASLAWEVLFWQISGITEEEYEQGEAFLGYSWANRWSVTLIYGRDTEFDEKTNPRIQKEELEKHRQGLPADPRKAIVDVRQHFVAGELTWFAADWLVVQALVGSLRGGVKCISSVCRNYPAFSGARAEVTLRY